MQHSDLYVMFNPFTGLVKIGISNDVESRRASLEHAGGVRLDVLAVFPGEEGREGALHLAFGHVRQCGEWFLPTPEIVDLVEGRETPESLLRRMSTQSDENARAINHLADAKREQQRQERDRERERLESVRAEEARIKREESEKRAAAKVERERKENERRERERVEWEAWDVAAKARDALYKSEPRERFAQLARDRAALITTSQRARNCATVGVKVTE